MVLFFEKGAPIRNIWFYQLDAGRSLGKTNALNDEDLAEFVELQKTFADSPKSWSKEGSAVDASTYDLTERGWRKTRHVLGGHLRSQRRWSVA